MENKSNENKRNKSESPPRKEAIRAKSNRSRSEKRKKDLTGHILRKNRSLPRLGSKKNIDLNPKNIQQDPQNDIQEENSDPPHQNQELEIFFYFTAHGANSDSYSDSLSQGSKTRESENSLFSEEIEEAMSSSNHSLKVEKPEENTVTPLEELTGEALVKKHNLIFFQDIIKLKKDRFFLNNNLVQRRENFEGFYHNFNQPRNYDSGNWSNDYYFRKEKGRGRSVEQDTFNNRNYYNHNRWNSWNGDQETQEWYNYNCQGGVIFPRKYNTGESYMKDETY